MFMKMSRYSPSRDKVPRLYVGRLPSRASERDIERLFKGYGRLREINLKNGYGFVVCTRQDNLKLGPIRLLNLAVVELFFTQSVVCVHNPG